MGNCGTTPIKKGPVSSPQEMQKNAQQQLQRQLTVSQEKKPSYYRVVNDMAFRDLLQFNRYMLSEEHNHILQQFDYKLDRNLFFKKMDEFIVKYQHLGEVFKSTEETLHELHQVHPFPNQSTHPLLDYTHLAEHVYTLKNFVMKELLATQYFNSCQVVHYLKGISSNAANTHEIKQLLTLFLQDIYQPENLKFQELLQQVKLIQEEKEKEKDRREGMGMNLGASQEQAKRALEQELDSNSLNINERSNDVSCDYMESMEENKLADQEGVHNLQEMKNRSIPE